MRHGLVYDLPTRIFHWFFVLFFLTAIIIAKVVDDESLIFSYHMLAGFSLCYLVILRIIWGFCGSKYALFSNFSLNPIELLNYFKDLVGSRRMNWAGHNPASSWSAIVMLFLAVGLAVTGYFMALEINKDEIEDIHEVLANSFIVIAILHVSGIIIHSLTHKEFLALSMITGKKSNIETKDQIPSSKQGVGIFLLILIVGFITYLKSNFNPNEKTLHVFGQSITLGHLEEDDEAYESNDDIRTGVHEEHEDDDE